MAESEHVLSELTTDLVSDPRTPRLHAWERDAARRFHDRMLDRAAPFPCVFGVDALRKATLRYAFVPGGPERPRALAEALRDFVRLAPELGRRTSLVAFFQPDFDPDLQQDFQQEDDAAPGHRTVADYRRELWDLLQSLHELDDAAWPEDIPLDPEDPEWEFSFSGMPMFVVANTPAHQRRMSRYFEYFTITFQPRFVFDDISEDSLPGRNARTIIRGRLADYDAVPASPVLGSYGKPGNKEWVQYFLGDDNAPGGGESRCPLHVRAKPDEHGDAHIETHKNR
ncbi:YqcI/YcgG family protein [Streptomyces pathocidini]|uniref:YqcI/YcgG family protein n=1 Tax=Streptomyces pathocidini TaxID=1650571 RepID=UPI0033F7DF23